MILPVACLLSIFAEYAVAVDPLVHLGYASYNGVELSNGVTQWLGLPYAAPPLGSLRFAAPTDINIENREYQADTHGPACIGIDSNPIDIGSSSRHVSEDCLKLDIYAPASATAGSQLPVYLYIPGGGFSASSVPPNGSTLVHNSGHEIIYVSLTYRVGPYGFLTGDSSNLAAESGSPEFSYNNGLKDQLKALQWVKKHIQSFGGNPSHLVLGGASAGAGSVVLHVSNPDTSALLAGATAESASWPPLLTPEEGDYIFSNISALTSCTSASNALACLRALPASTLQHHLRSQRFRLPNAPGAPLFAYAPTLDGNLVREYTYAALWGAPQSYTHALPPLLLGATTHDGLTFAPPTLNAALYAADAFISAQFPRLSANDLAWLHAHPYYAPLIARADFRGFAARAFGSLRYACPALFVAWAVPSRAQSRRVWLYRWDVGAALHVAEQPSLFRGAGAVRGGIVGSEGEVLGSEGAAVTSEGGITVGSEGGVVGNAATDTVATAANNDKALAAAANVQAYFISFVRFLDPNPGRAPGAPVWGATGGLEASGFASIDADIDTDAKGTTSQPQNENEKKNKSKNKNKARAEADMGADAAEIVPAEDLGEDAAEMAATTWLPQRMLFTDHDGDDGEEDDGTRMEILDTTQWDQCVYLIDRGLLLQQ